MTRLSRPPVFKTGLLYFGLVFGTGFVLGIIRLTLLVPRLGVRYAELLELPFMLLASYLAARYCLRRCGPFSRPQRLGLGLLALACLVAAELGLTVAMGRGLGEYLSGRDPVSGPAYFLALLVFGLLPALLRQEAPAPRSRA